MIDYVEFITALKSSWIRRTIQSEAKWTKLLEAQMKIKIKQLWLRGSDYIGSIANRLSNKFWKEVFESWKKLTIINNCNDKNIENEHVWNNPNILVNKKPLFYKNFYESGIILINDLYNENGEFHDFDFFKQLDVKTNFIEYAGLKRAVLKRLTSLNIHLEKKNIGPQIPSSIRIFFKNVKGCKDMYNLLICSKREPITSISKWNTDGYHFCQNDWNKIFELPFKTTTDSSVRWMQFQLLHRILPTNRYLSKLKISDSSLCYFCKTEEETLEHLFVDCYIVKEMWVKIEEWFLNKFNIHVSFDRQSIMFGKHQNTHMHRVENLLLLTVKQSIFRCKYNKSPRPVNSLIISSITERFFVEKALLLNNGKYLEYERNWKQICDKL